MMKDIKYHRNDFQILGDTSKAVPLAGNRHYPQEMKSLRCRGILEDVRPGAECHWLTAALEHHQGVHQRIAVIRGNDHGLPVIRERPLYVEPRETAPGAAIYPMAQE